MDKPEFIKKLASLVLDLNHIHPFREGNGRALRELIREIATNHGYSLR
ncbi:Fic family protein [endosymbiont 'TC1' of Trimyema compressum]